MSNGILLMLPLARFNIAIKLIDMIFVSCLMFVQCNRCIFVSARNTESTTMDQLREENKRLHEELAKVKFN